MAKKYKKRKKDTAHRTPPLSKLDKAIYTDISVLFGIVFLGSIIGWTLFQRWFRFRDPTVIACRGRPSNYVAVAPLLLFVLVFGITALDESFGEKRPLFGNKAIRYGEYPWKTDFFPLFGPQHRKIQRRPSEQRFRANMIRILTGIFIVTLLLGCLGIYGRICLREDRTIVSYNCLNKPGEPISIARDCERIMIKAEKRSTRSSEFYHYGVVIYSTEGKKYEFNNANFDIPNRGHTACLRQLLAIKALFSADQITIEREDLLPKVIEDNDLDEAQTALLYQLFEPPQ